MIILIENDKMMAGW